MRPVRERHLPAARHPACQAVHANPVVGHPIVNVEAFRRAEIVATVNSGREHDIRNGPAAFLRQLWGQHRLRRTIMDHLRMSFESTLTPAE